MNPVRYGGVAATITATKEEVATIRLIDLSGKVLETKEHWRNIGVTSMDLGAPGRPAENVYHPVCFGHPKGQQGNDQCEVMK